MKRNKAIIKGLELALALVLGLSLGTNYIYAQEETDPVIEVTPTTPTETPVDKAMDAYKALQEVLAIPEEEMTEQNKIDKDILEQAAKGAFTSLTDDEKTTFLNSFNETERTSVSELLSTKTENTEEVIDNDMHAAAIQELSGSIAAIPVNDLTATSFEEAQELEMSLGSLRTLVDQLGEDKFDATIIENLVAAEKKIAELKASFTEPEAPAEIPAEDIEKIKTRLQLQNISLADEYMLTQLKDWIETNKEQLGADYDVLVNMQANAMIRLDSLKTILPVFTEEEEAKYYARIGDEKYETLDEAVAAAVDGDVIEIIGILYIDKLIVDKSVTFLGVDEGIKSQIIVKAETNRNNTGKTHGFDLGDWSSGKTVNFENLIISAEDESKYGVLQLIWIHNTLETPVDVNITNCTLSNVNDGGVYRDAVSMEYASGNDKYYFNLEIDGSEIYSRSYGFGSGLNNGNPDVSDCTANIHDSYFSSDGGGSIYNIHTPKAFKELVVERNTFNSVRSGGIKYIYSSDNIVKINDNDFSNCNQAQLSGTYALMATTQEADYFKDARAYSYATELRNNNFENQNTIIAVKSPVEVIWFPDGQAENDYGLNNYGDLNITDEGTRYVRSLWGGNKQFITLTDFNIMASEMTFKVGGQAKVTSYNYNTVKSSGAYTNSIGGFDAYWTEENPSHAVETNIASWEQANNITRYTIGKDSNHVLFSDVPATTENEDLESLNILVAEDEVAKFEINQLTGEIKVTPKKVGTTYLNAYVGSGIEFDESGNPVIGDIPNAKKDILKVVVSNKDIPDPNPDPKPDPEPEEEIEEPETPEVGPEEPVDPEEEIDEEETPETAPKDETPDTGAKSNSAWMSAFFISLFTLFVLVVRRKRV